MAIFQHIHFFSYFIKCASGKLFALSCESTPCSLCGPSAGPHEHFFLSVSAIPGIVTTGTGGSSQRLSGYCCLFLLFWHCCQWCERELVQQIFQEVPDSLAAAFLDTSYVSEPRWGVFFLPALDHCTEVTWLCVQLQPRPYTKCP